MPLAPQRILVLRLQMTCLWGAFVSAVAVMAALILVARAGFDVSAACKAASATSAAAVSLPRATAVCSGPGLELACVAAAVSWACAVFTASTVPCDGVGVPVVLAFA